MISQTRTCAVTNSILWYYKIVFVISQISSDIEAHIKFINFIWNEHECKILFIIWLFQMGFYRLKRRHYFNRKHCIHVKDSIMTLRASNQVLCNVWSYDFYDMTLATE